MAWFSWSQSPWSMGRLLRAHRILWTQFLLRQKGITFEGRVRTFQCRTHFVRGENGVFQIGRDLSVTAWRAPTYLICGESATLRLGDFVRINGGVYIHAVSRLEIGSYTRIAPEVRIFDCGYHQAHEGGEPRLEPVVIGKNVWIQWGAKVLAGSEIGDHSIVAPNTVVKGSFPARSIIEGNPCKVIGSVRCSDGWIRR